MGGGKRVSEVSRGGQCGKGVEGRAGNASDFLLTTILTFPGRLVWWGVGGIITKATPSIFKSI